MLDIKIIAMTATANLRSLLSSWIPGGTFSGNEYTVKNPLRNDSAAGSFRINVATGAWADFATGDKGGDAVSLYAYLNNISQGKAASELSRVLGINQEKPRGDRAQYVTMIWPAGSAAPDVPALRNIKNESGEWLKYPFTNVWKYRDAAGVLLGAVVRYETETGKETPPLTLWKMDDGSTKWRFKSFPEPRPIYGLDLLTKFLSAQVVVVEGEKSAKVFQDVIDAAGQSEKMVVVTWPGGAKAIRKVDFTPLRGRKIILWPDFDKQEYPDRHDRAGQVMDPDDQPGVQAMNAIGRILGGMGAEIKILKTDFDHASGWDVADAILVDKMTFPQIVDFVRARLVAVRTGKPEATDPAPVQKPERTDRVEFEALGFNCGYYYYLPSRTSQVVALRASDHSKTNLLSMAPESFWFRDFPGKSGPDYNAATDDLFRRCERRGIYDPSKIRGRGAWFDAGRSVLHLGDRLIVDGQETAISDFKSRFVYQAGFSLEHEPRPPLGVQDAHKLRDITDFLFWDRPISGTLLAGWCVISTICGSLAHRPHLWMTGSAGTGKSFVFENIILRILGNFCLPALSDSSAAGIRQDLGHDALPVVVDEFEGEDAFAQGRVQKMLELARQAFSETSAKIIKGSQSGKPVSYSIRSCFLFSSIGVNVKMSADATRILVLGLAKPYDRAGQTAAEHFSELCRRTAETITDDWAAAFRARAIKMVPIIRKNAQIFAAAIAGRLGNRRSGDQMGAILAGAWSLSSDRIISQDEAAEFVRCQDWEDQKEIHEESDEKKCLSTIIHSIIKIPELKLDLSIAEVIERYKTALSDPTLSENPGSEFDAALRRNGIRSDPDGGLVYISNSHDSIKKILRNTPWENSWSRILKRIPGAVPVPAMRFFGSNTRALGIPWNTIFG